MGVPQTEIFICSRVRLNSRYEHSIYFEDSDVQNAYFRGKVVKTLTSYTFVRREWELQVKGSMDECRTWNYLFFRNSATGKWWYYFIDKVEYVNENNIKLTLTMDVIQSYLFDFNFLPCFVERQHTSSDEVGEHTLLENLETGEYISQGFEIVSELTQNMCIIIQTTINPNNNRKILGTKLDGLFSGMGVYAVNVNHWTDLAEYLEQMSDDGKLDAIMNMWMYPQELIQIDSSLNWGDEDPIFKPVLGAITKDVSFVDAPQTLDGYEPRNKKLLSYPYNFLYVSNNLGTSGVYKFERFENGCDFRLHGSLSPDGAVKLIPQNYNGIISNHEEGIVLAGFPTCAWNADVYKIWLAQNQNQHNLTMATAGLTFTAGAVSAGASVLTGNLIGAGAGVGMMAHSASTIAGLLATKADKALEPPQSRGTYSTSVNYANQKHTFMAYFKTITKENARVIDEFFDMYGYQVNRVTVPQIYTRPHFTYTKTVGCHIQSFLCNEDACKIEEIFDKGITFWKDGDEIGNYTLARTNMPE